MRPLEAAEAKIEREDKIRAEINRAFDSSNFRVVVVDAIVELVERYSAEEREACAKECDDIASQLRDHHSYPAYGLNSQVQALVSGAQRIRARGDR